ncbi:MAG TPA: MFS transporter, partial [Flavisolibacter sp.]|nr:MFS transporter [Flavisolibacter sp.]
YRILKLSPNEIIEPLVLPAAIVTFIGYISYGVILTLIPDLSQHLGIANKGLFYVVFTLSSLLMRFMAGRISDRKGRIIVLKFAILLVTSSLLMIAISRSPIALLSGAFVYGIGTGLFSPASAAWTADLSHRGFRGRAMATMYIALELGIGSGAFLSGWIVGDHIEVIPLIFYCTAIISLSGFIYLYAYSANKTRVTA